VALFLYHSEGDGSMEDREHDNSWMNDPARNENRYAQLIEGSLFPPWTLFRESFREDHKLLLPRMIFLSMRTARQIPGAVMMKAGKGRDAVVYRVLRSWGKRICRLGQVRLSVLGAEKLDHNATYLFAVNHMSPMDIPAIYAALPVKAAFVANSIFRKIPVFSYWMRKSGAVFVEQGNPELEMQAFKDMLKRLKKKRSLILFPEGYIFQGEGLADFKRGGLHAAVLTDTPIIPLCIYGTQHVIRAGSLHIVPRSRVVIEFGDPVLPSSLDRASRKDIERVVHDRLAAMKARHASDWYGSRHR